MFFHQVKLLWQLYMNPCTAQVTIIQGESNPKVGSKPIWAKKLQDEIYMTWAKLKAPFSDHLEPGQTLQSQKFLEPSQAESFHLGISSSWAEQYQLLDSGSISLKQDLRLSYI